MSRQGILQKIPGTSNSMKCNETGGSDLPTGSMGLKTASHQFWKIDALEANWT